MPFEITTRIHFGYMREPGIHVDLTDADMDNLAAPRPGLPSGYGRRIDSPQPRSAPAQQQTEEPIPHEATAPSAVAPGPSSNPARPDDPPPPPSEPAPFVCRDAGCERAGKPFANRVGRDTHEKAKHGRVLND